MSWSRAARRLAGGFFIIGLGVLSGCATPLQSERLSSSAFPDPIELTAVPFFAQDEYQCGPAALAMALTWAGIATTPTTLAPQIYLPDRRGTLQLELLANARRHGAIPYVLRPQLETLLQEVAAGNPVIVFQNLGLSWYPKWHYAVVIGFDVARDQVILRSGLEQRHLVPFTAFERTWRRGEYWGMVVMPPTRLPRTADETSYLQAIAALERLQRWQDTASAYVAAQARWPQSATAALGLGNSHYALKNFAGAEHAYRAAIALNPQSADAFNNLAQTLAEQHRWREAEQAIRQALSLGGAQRATYESTLAEINARRAASP